MGVIKPFRTFLRTIRFVLIFERQSSAIAELDMIKVHSLPLYEAVDESVYRTLRKDEPVGQFRPLSAALHRKQRAI